jgi:putative ABC transport system permease protein
MQTLWMRLAEKSILTDANIRSMKEYIAQKFPMYSSSRKASILANSVHRHMDAYLPPIDEVWKERLRIQLLQTAYSQNNFRIVSLDIFKVCLELSLGNQEILNPLEQWIRLQGEDLSPEQMAPFIGMIKESFEVQVQNQTIYRTEHDQIALYFPIHTHWYVKLWNKNNKRNVGLILLTLLLSFNLSTKHVFPHETIFFNIQPLLLSSLTEEVVTRTSLLRTHPDLLTMTLMQKVPIAPENELTTRYMYIPIEKEPIRQWLKERNSLLAKEPYLSTIIATAEQYNIHPFLLLAIAGQEQSLVPRSNKKASQIANNPFNVHHSWKDYNTDIADSARIAAETILKLIKGRPKDTHPLEWINRKYAEDPKWHIGVEAYFKQMLHLLETPS